MRDFMAVLGPANHTLKISKNSVRPETERFSRLTYGHATTSLKTLSVVKLASGASDQEYIDEGW